MKWYKLQAKQEKSVEIQLHPLAAITVAPRQLNTAIFVRPNAHTVSNDQIKQTLSTILNDPFFLFKAPKFFFLLSGFLLRSATVTYSRFEKDFSTKAYKRTRQLMSSDLRVMVVFGRLTVKLKVFQRDRKRHKHDFMPC